MSKHGYKFYMQACDKNGNILADSVKKDLEVDFNTANGKLLYSKIVGVETRGKRRSYVETYAESDRLRVHLPEEITYDATKIELTLYFIGEDRYKVYDAFNDYVLNGFHKWTDTARNKTFDFFIQDEIKLSDTQWYGSIPYITCTYALSNMNGRTFDIE